MTDAPTPLTTAPVAFGTPATPRISVRGVASMEVAPESVGIRVTVRARGGDRDAVLADLTRRNAAALELVRSYGDEARASSGELRVTPELSSRGRGERVRAYVGEVSLTVELFVPSVLGELVSGLAELELTDLGGPWWRLRPDSPVHAEVRRRAVREAVGRAREYAEALGSRLVALVELSDVPDDDMMPRPRGAGGRFLAEAEAVLDLEPEPQWVSAVVTAHFTATPPDLTRPEH
ncbi:SIMPL domain-containing protein [Streptomyces sp. NPDC057638]|uniref:SIMPL domain-containing protein n=1 Tax=Streptomyces sp. NPDC057638 TaxID=3346190 RepID=UPI003686CF87